MSIKKFLHSYPNLVIGSLAVIFIVVLVSFYFWAVGDVFVELHSALTPAPSVPVQGFNIAGAAKLDLHGLIATSTAQ